MKEDLEQMNLQNIKDYYNSNVSKAYRHFDYFKTRENIVLKLLNESIGKSVLDIGAGDGFWLRCLLEKLDSYIAIEKGDENCQLLLKNFCIYEKKLQVLNVDAFQFDYLKINADTLFFGFFISHFNFSSIINLIKHISQNVDYSRILILDSFWSDYRKTKFIDNELKLQRRIINNNGDFVEIPKRYITLDNLQELSSMIKMKLEIKYLDEYWCLTLLTK